MSQPDMGQILAQAQAMQAKLQEAQQEIISTSMEGTAGNGLVRVTMEGNGTVSAVNIDPQVVDPNDVETLQDLVLGAIADAHQKITKFAEERMAPLSQAMNGGGLGDLF